MSFITVSPSGTTAQRPTQNLVGQRYFDTDLAQPVWWNGFQWVDFLGVAA